ncbi:MAG: porin [Gammaproteobacteria bacterium]|nr:porin [Gammaproteobacteria bacterium]
MKKPFLIALALAAAPFAAQAETWNIYGWQNHSWEFVDIDGGRSYDRIQSNAGNIGFAASMDAGNDISVNVQCEQFTYYNHFAGGTGWCNRNSKIGLSHPQMGEIMFATWLLPYNEGVAQWVDPFYDAGADSHTSIMGSVGANTIFYNTGDFDFQASASGPGTGLSGAEFNYAVAGYDTGFNRRQENIIQYWSPNWNGFVFRFAWTAGNRDESNSPRRKMEGTNCVANCGEIDPVIRSSSLAYTNGPFWGAVTWQDHEDWTAVSVGEMDSSDAESFRIAGRYIHDLGDGVSIQISAMWEDLEYEFNNVSSVDKAMAAFGYGKFNETGNLMVTETEIRSQKTIGLLHELFGDDTETADDTDGISDFFVGIADEAVPLKSTAEEDHPLTKADETSKGNTVISIESEASTGTEDADTAFNASRTALINAITALEALADATVGAALTAEDGIVIASVTQPDIDNAKLQYKMLKDSATANARGQKAGNVKIERDAWMVSGKIKFGGPIDFRFSYMDADDLEVSCGACSGDWEETAADAWNVGMFYTMPGGTELRLTYSEVNNDDNGTYGQGISGTGLGSPGAEIEMFAVGIVHWFD